MSTEIQVVGQVVSGRGLGTQRVLRHVDELRAITNQPPFPGTLNVILNRPLRLLASAGRTFDSEGGAVWPASFRDLEVWLYRWPTCPLHVVELFSTIHLREHFSLADGDDVHLRVSREHTGTIDVVGRISWAALWTGRRESFFLRESCHTGDNRTMIWSSLFGALQKPAEVQGARRVSLHLAKAVIRETAAAGARFTRRLKRKSAL